MYANDSFLTLGLMGQIGLIGVSSVLTALALWIAWRATRGRAWHNRILIALGVLFVFQWLSPQVYYTYYQAIFDGLPWQIVINKPPDLRDFYDVLFFRGPTTLSAHGQGVLGWALILIALLRQTFGGLGASVK